MLYYGRKWAAEEAMESFLRQIYPHKKLMIVNTHPDPVYFNKEYPNVEVHNCLPDTFKTLNEKYAYALNNVNTKWWAPWDSDDIWLPWHLENLARHIPKTKKNAHPRKIGVSRCYFWIVQKNRIEIGWNMWGTAIWETFDSKGNHHASVDPYKTTNCDRQILYQEWDRYWIPRRTVQEKKENPLSFIFRWNLKDNHNRSAVLGENGIKRAKALSDKLAKTYLKEPWNPHWNEDYVEKVNEKRKYKNFTGL